MLGIRPTLGRFFTSEEEQLTAAPTVIVTDMVAVSLVALTVYLSYRFASRLIAYLGETGTIVFLRLSSFILMCVGVSIIWSGIVDLVLPFLTMWR